MQRTTRLRPVQSPAPTGKVGTAPTTPPRHAVDLLVLTIGDHHPELPIWISTCQQCQLAFGQLRLEDQPGVSTNEKEAGLMNTIQDWRISGRLDRGTQIMVLAHGEKVGPKLGIADEDEKHVIDDGARFAQALRAAAGEPGQPWDGTIYFGPCGSAVLRKTVRHEPGHTVLLSGYKSVTSLDLARTFDQILRAWSAEPRSAEAPTTEQMRRLWVEARKHCGEHISWCGQGKVRTHKAGDFDFLARPRPEKRTLVLYAKLSHGSADAVKRVAGGKPRVVFSTHRHAAFLPLAEAASSTRDTSEKLEFLINSGQNVNERDSSGRSALLIATTSGNLSAMRTLLQHGADPWLPNNDGDLPWQVGDGPAVALLMEDPATDAPAPNRPDLISFPLHAACAAGDLARLKLLAPNADALRAKDAQDNTPLGAALLHGRLAIMESLLKQGANPNAWVNNKEALLAYAVLHGQTEAVRLLLKYGAKPARSDRQGMPLLMRAMHAVHAGRAGMDLLKLVLETDAGRAALENALPLHYACHLADPALAQTLLESGADPSRMDGKGKSAADFVTELSRSRQNWDSFELKLAMLEAMQRVKAN